MIGGGPAGLSAAVVLGRLRRSVVVIDDRAGRSLWWQVTRNYLGFPDGVEANELRRLGRVQAARYGTRFVEGTATRIRPDGTTFIVDLAPRRPDDPAAGSIVPGDEANVARERRLGEQLGEGWLVAPAAIRARSVVVATGVRDDFPEFPGRDSCVGRSLFWCIVCDGYEASARAVAVLGSSSEAIETAFGLRQFSDAVSLVTGSNRGDAIPAALRGDLETAGVAVFDGRAVDFEHDDGQIRQIRLDDGAARTLDVEMVFAVGDKRPRSDIAAEAGAAANELGYLIVDEAGATSVDGLFAAGDVSAPHGHQVSAAVHEGATVGTAVNYRLYGELQRVES